MTTSAEPKLTLFNTDMMHYTYMEKVNEKTRENLKKSRDENKTDKEFPTRTGINKPPKLDRKTDKRKSHKSIQ